MGIELSAKLNRNKHIEEELVRHFTGSILNMALNNLTFKEIGKAVTVADIPEVDTFDVEAIKERVFQEIADAFRVSPKRLKDKFKIVLEVYTDEGEQL